MTFNSSNYNFQYYQYGVDITKSDLTVDSNSNFVLNKFNEIDLALTFGLLELNKNTALMSQVVTKIRNTNQKFYSVRQLAQDYPAFNTILDSVFSSNFNDFSTTWQDYVDIHYKYDIAYEPYLSFANYHYNNIDFEKQLFIAAPLEISNPDIVNDNLYPDNDDVLPMWILDSGSYKMTTIDFELAKIMDHPVLLINNGMIGLDSYTPFTSVPNPYTDGGGTYTPPISYHTCLDPTFVHEKIVLDKFYITTTHDINSAEFRFRARAGLVTDTEISSFILKELGEEKKFAYNKKITKSQLDTYFNVGLDIYSRNALFENGDDHECFHLSEYTVNKDIHFLAYAFELDYAVFIPKVVGERVLKLGAFQCTYEESVNMRFNSDTYFAYYEDNYGFKFSSMPSIGSTKTKNYCGRVHYERKLGL